MVLKPVLVANRLWFTDVSLASIVPRLSALALDPGWLVTVAEVQAEDPTLQCYITHAAPTDSEFCVCMVHVLPLLYCTPHANTFQLVIPANCSLR